MTHDMHVTLTQVHLLPLTMPSIHVHHRNVRTHSALALRCKIILCVCARARARECVCACVYVCMYIYVHTRFCSHVAHALLACDTRFARLAILLVDCGCVLSEQLYQQRLERLKRLKLKRGGAQLGRRERAGAGARQRLLQERRLGVRVPLSGGQEFLIWMLRAQALALRTPPSPREIQMMTCRSFKL
jgi:hypothetical protein